MPKKMVKRTRNFSKSVKNIVRKMSETKCFYSPVSITTLVNTDGGKVDVVQIDQGSDSSNRIGSNVQLRHLKMSMQISTSATGISGTPVRVMLFYSPTESAANLALVNYLTGSYDPKRYFPLYDRYHSFKTYYDGTNTQEQGPIVINISKKIKYFQKYGGITGSSLLRDNLILVVNQQNSPTYKYDF